MSSPYLDQAQAAFLRSPLLDKYTVLSKQYLNLVGTSCASDYSSYCANVDSSPYSSNELGVNPIPPGLPRDLRGRDGGLNAFGRPFSPDRHPHHHRRLEGPHPGPGPDDAVDFQPQWGHPMPPRDQRHMGPPGLGPADPLAGLRLFPLGYGAQGDACLINSFPEVSGKCQQSLMMLQDLRLSYWRDTAAGAMGAPLPPHGPGLLGILLIIAILSSILFCCFKKFGKRFGLGHDIAVRNLIVAINANPVLKETVESSTGVPVPPPHSVGTFRFLELFRGYPYIPQSFRRQDASASQTASAPPMPYERVMTSEEQAAFPVANRDDGNRRVFIV